MRHKVYFIEHWKDGYWSADRKKFGGILFATHYYDLELLELICKEQFHPGDGPIFIKEAFV